MKIVGIVGVLYLPKSEGRVWRNLRCAYEEEFPGCEFVVEKMLYLPWQKTKMRAFAQRILERHDHGQEIILLGYSLGGVIACAIAERFAKSRVRAVVTIVAPHRVGLFYRALGTKRHLLRMPVFTFTGLFDVFVPRFLTMYPGNIHADLRSDHLLFFILSQEPARAVARGTRAGLAPRGL
ncbi:MAG: alpha/beta fold hydrolase [bacterium]|nr:alpha/beta fold hydrolase [bacterium]